MVDRDNNDIYITVTSQKELLTLEVIVNALIKKQSLIT